MTEQEQLRTLRQWFWNRDEILPQASGHVLISDWSPRNRVIAKSLMFLVAAKEPTDFVTVCDELVRDGVIDNAGGMEYVAALIGFPSYLEVVK